MVEQKIVVRVLSSRCCFVTGSDLRRFAHTKNLERKCFKWTGMLAILKSAIWIRRCAAHDFDVAKQSL